MIQAIVIQREKGRILKGCIIYECRCFYGRQGVSYSEELWNFYYNVIGFNEMYSCLYLFFSLY